MPRDRFKIFLRFLRFDDLETRRARQATHPLAPIRHIIDGIKATLLSIYTPGQWTTFDEHLCRYRGRCSFKQFIPSKPDRYGIKIFKLVDALNYFPITFEIYCGKQELSNKPKELVLRLSSVLKPGHIICADNYFSSLSLSFTLVEDLGIYYLGTLRKCRLEIPKPLRENRGLPLFSSRLFYCDDKNTSMLSYVTKKNKSVLLLSNIHSKIIIPPNSKKSRSTIILHYNSHKGGGVDKLNQMLKEYRIHRANRRWPAVYFLIYLGLFAMLHG